MTFAEICQSGKDMLTPGDVCEVLECNPHSIRNQAQRDASRLGFPVIVIGSRVRIPRTAFVQYLLGAKNERKEDEA